MAPLSVTESVVDPGQVLQDQAECLATNLVTKYLRYVAKSSKLAKKFEEKLNSSMNLNKTDITEPESISIEEVLNKQHSKSNGEGGKEYCHYSGGIRGSNYFYLDRSLWQKLQRLQTF